MHVVTETLTKTNTNMKEMFSVLKEQWNDDPKEMIYGMLFMIGWVGLTYFLLWFGSMFCYDM